MVFTRRLACTSRLGFTTVLARMVKLGFTPSVARKVHMGYTGPLARTVQMVCTGPLARTVHMGYTGRLAFSSLFQAGEQPIDHAVKLFLSWREVLAACGQLFEAVVDVARDGVE